MQGVGEGEGGPNGPQRTAPRPLTVPGPENAGEGSLRSRAFKSLLRTWMQRRKPRSWASQGETQATLGCGAQGLRIPAPSPAARPRPAPAAPPAPSVSPQLVQGDPVAILGSAGGDPAVHPLYPGRHTAHCPLFYLSPPLLPVGAPARRSSHSLPPAWGLMTPGSSQVSAGLTCVCVWRGWWG